MMGLGFFVLNFKGHRYVYHDGDQGGFSSEMFIDPAGHTASILAVNTTDTGAPAPSSTLHPQSNTEPDARHRPPPHPATGTDRPRVPQLFRSALVVTPVVAVSVV